jgi:hypothetical protein
VAGMLVGKVVMVTGSAADCHYKGGCRRQGDYQRRRRLADRQRCLRNAPVANAEGHPLEYRCGGDQHRLRRRTGFGTTRCPVDGRPFGCIDAVVSPRFDTGCYAARAGPSHCFLEVHHRDGQSRGRRGVNPAARTLCVKSPAHRCGLVTRLHENPRAIIAAASPALRLRRAQPRRLAQPPSQPIPALRRPVSRRQISSSIRNGPFRALAHVNRPANCSKLSACGEREEAAAEGDRLVCVLVGAGEHVDVGVRRGRLVRIGKERHRLAQPAQDDMPRAGCWFARSSRAYPRSQTRAGSLDGR